MSGAARIPDFLDRMVDKAFGQQTAIDPRLPSVFEPRGFGLEAEELPAAPRAVAARSENEVQAGDGVALPDDDPRETTGESPAPVLRAAMTESPVRGSSGSRRQPDALFEAAKPHDRTSAPSDRETVLAAAPGTENAIAVPKQTAQLRPAPRVTGVAPSIPAPAARQSVAAKDEDAGLPGVTASIPSATATASDAANIRQPDAIAPKRSFATPGAFDARRTAAATMPAAEMQKPAGAATFQITARGTRAPVIDAMAVKRPAPERGGPAAPQSPGSELPSAEDDLPQQGVLLPVAMPMQRTPFAPALAAQRRAAPQGGDAQAASPSVVNVTIGRVEVRGPGAPAQRGGEKREPRPLSLADYLERRSER